MIKKVKLYWWIKIKVHHQVVVLRLNEMLKERWSLKIWLQDLIAFSIHKLTIEKPGTRISMKKWVTILMIYRSLLHPKKLLRNKKLHLRNKLLLKILRTKMKTKALSTKIFLMMHLLTWANSLRRNNNNLLRNRRRWLLWSHQRKRIRVSLIIKILLSKMIKLKKKLRIRREVKERILKWSTCWANKTKNSWTWSPKVKDPSFTKWIKKISLRIFQI